MGLDVVRVRFKGAPPVEATFRRELLEELGDLGGLEGYEVLGNVVEVRILLDAMTKPYAIKVLLRLGGEYLDWITLEPRDPRLPAFVSRRWRDWPWWKRAWIWLRYRLGLLATALPAQRIL